jgi:hypothetical protein
MVGERRDESPLRLELSEAGGDGDQELLKLSGGAPEPSGICAVTVAWGYPASALREGAAMMVSTTDILNLLRAKPGRFVKDISTAVGPQVSKSTFGSAGVSDCAVRRLFSL